MKLGESCMQQHMNPVPNGKSSKPKLYMMEIVPGSVKEVWDEWGIRLMVICSLLLQVILIFIGNRRKFVAVTWIRVILWFAYLSADWFATVALGALSNKMGDDSNKTNHDKIKNQLQAFWAPFLLLHLGGPDTITAYSLEDNELWLRHLLGLFVQSGVAIYIFIISWKSGWISYINIPIFLAGFIKYGERTWVLRSASREQFRDSMLNPPDPGPNYAKFMDEFSLKTDEGFHISIGYVNEDPNIDEKSRASTVEKESISDLDILLNSYYFFENFKRLFADLILSFQDRDKSRYFFRQRLPKDAFNVIELELAFIYDVLYTKAILVNSVLGCILRSISFSSTVSAFIVFLIMEKHGYEKIDTITTYSLLIAAILLEMYAVVLLLSSDWTILWAVNHKDHQVTYPNSQFLCSVKPLSKQRWSNSMAQYNLISFCLKDKPTILKRIYKLFCIDQLIEKHHYKSYEKVSDDLKKLIFEQLEEKSIHATHDLEVCRKLCTRRGSEIFEKNDCAEIIGWSINMEFDQSILLWHIATDLCYYSDIDASGEKEKGEMSKVVSDYMLYLLVIRPFMLPAGIGQIRFGDTCAEAKSYFQERTRFITNEAEACMRLLKVSTDILPIQVKGDRSKSVLFDACRLAKSLQELEREKKWTVISHMWVEMLCYAANQCKGIYHAQQLVRGGELLTHVWLLMAHLGITEQFQISQGHKRVKLDIK